MQPNRLIKSYLRVVKTKKYVTSKESHPKSFTFPEEIIELYQWRNGTGYGTFFVSPESSYDEQEFHSLATGLGYGEEWEEDYCPGTPLLGLFTFEGTQYWTILPDTPQEFAPIYVSDEPNFDTTSPSYPWF